MSEQGSFPEADLARARLLAAKALAGDLRGERVPLALVADLFGPEPPTGEDLLAQEGTSSPGSP